MSPEGVTKRLLIEEEGRRLQPYYDSKGYVTGGIGRLLDPRKVCPLPDAVVDLMFEYDYSEHAEAAKKVPGFDRLNTVQQAVIISMVFQMGLTGVLGFKKMCKALARGDLQEAYREGLDSEWAKEDTPRRARRQMAMLRSGLWIPRDTDV